MTVGGISDIRNRPFNAGGYLYLNELRVYGFKSFPDPIHLKFNRGITGFVGPNGSGKSNVVDAIRWTLGEQSAKELRATLMEDVIFNGTYKRSGSNLASVSMKFTNEGELPLDFSEVELERKLYRNGDSQYLINKETVRLKDIQNLLADTGLGVKAYSLFKRSLIEDIVNNKPDALRNLFEESAGISTYRHAKKDSLRKLIHTQEKLNRINDLIGEIEKQHRDLKRQANKAQRYNEYKAVFQNLSEYVIRKRIEGFKNRIRTIEETLMQKDERINNIKKEIDEIKALLHEKRENRRELEISLSGKNKLKDEASRKVYEMSSEISVSKEKINSLTDRIKLTEENRNKQTQEQPLREQRLVKYNERMQELQRKMEQLEKEVKDIEENTIETLYRQKEEDYTNSAADIRKTENAVILKKSELSSLNAKKDAIASRLEEKKNELQIEKNNLERALEEKSSTEESLKKTSEMTSAVKNEIEEIDKLAAEKKDDIEKLHNERQDIKDFISSRTAIIEQLNARMKENRSSLEELDNSGNIQFLRNSIEAHDGYEDFVKHAMSFVINAIILPAEMIKELENRKTSLINIIPEDMKTMRDNPEGLHNHMNCPEFAKAFFSHFISAEDYESIKNRNDSFYYVTRSGMVKTPAGLIVKAGEIQILNIEKSINEERVSIENKRTELENVEREISILNRETDELKAKRDDILRRTAELRSKESFVKESMNALTMRIESKERFIQKLQSIVEQTDNEYREMIQKIEASERFIRENEQRISEERGILSERETEFNRLKEEYIVFNSRRNESRTMLNDAENELRSLNSETAELKNIIEKSREEIINAAAVIDDCRENIDKYNKIISDIEIEQKEHRNALLSVEDEIGVLETKINDIDLLIDEKEDLEEEKTVIIGDLKEEKQKLLLEKEKINTEMDIDAKKTDPSFEIDDELIEKYKETAEEELKYIEEKMVRMEPINHLAFQEYSEVTQRLDDINVQKNDIVQAKENLEKTIKTLDAKAKTIFVQYFDTIRTNFKELFYDLFKSGNADIMLADEKDPLETDIQIIFEPGEKKVGRLVMLSDGERSMMIIALLFAMYMVRPTPVCIMDEIDGPLDDANVENFIQLLKKFRDRTQFILITHNKRTMEFCDYLFGVTMEESGVTGIFSLNLQSISQKFLKDATEQA